MASVKITIPHLQSFTAGLLGIFAGDLSNAPTVLALSTLGLVLSHSQRFILSCVVSGICQLLNAELNLKSNDRNCSDLS